MATGTAETDDGGVPEGAVLRRYAKAILERSDDLAPARDALVAALGESEAVMAASIVASFDGINRVADATGIRLDTENKERDPSSIVAALEFEALEAARS